MTGHRSSHPSFPNDPSALEAAISALLDQIQRSAIRAPIAGLDDTAREFRIITLLADGADHMAAHEAIKREWPVVAPLPFGQDLNTAINAQPKTGSDARAILRGTDPEDDATRARVAAIRDLADKAQVLELADQDEIITPAFLAACETPEDPAIVSEFVHLGSRRAELAGRILIEQSDILIAVWDGAGTVNPGGTGHTARLALEAGIPVMWLNPADLSRTLIVKTPEALADRCDAMTATSDDMAGIDELVLACMSLPPPTEPGAMAGIAALQDCKWRDQSSLITHPYRRIEAIFGEKRIGQKLASVKMKNERPDQITTGSAEAMLDAIGSIGRDAGGANQKAVADKIAIEVMPRFAWANGIAAWLSNSYRSGMVINFTMGALAIVAGVLYLPLVDTSQKWIFAGIEFAFLIGILLNTMIGQRSRFHGRWLETRRVAEYLRHSPVLFALGIARPSSAWPKVLRSVWPEWYAKMLARKMGLPEVRIDKHYLREAAGVLNDHFVIPQRDYHLAKSERLHRAHHSIERFAEAMFALAVLGVAIYLAAFGASQFGLIDQALVDKGAKWFTVLAVALPTISGAFAAIGYFGDFDRFADVSQLTGERLQELAARIEQYQHLPEERMSYSQLADLVRAADETTFAEIQAWQAVFSGKRTTVPA
ncbi:hypothetical protein FGU71_08745 [Erythrobacter insulae]|uniref:DUF4231 domain-containing protein n=1 Tax=Erythrobacter insulae TaxID=2584124 RepID=A0A547PCR4_9SPHN|nr:hypothetical protein [Erythrobacter insulae]TRD11933.1 hypothetical protein FGU71_08745 [Erythrobacter insulae]